MPFTQLPGVVGQFQALQENQLMMEGQKADLQSLALKQEDAQLTLQQKKLDLANQEAFRQTVLAKMSAGDQDRSQLATLSNQPTDYQKLHSSLEDLHGRMKNHVSLVQATQAAIQEYAHKDPLYAQKMQEELNSQIKTGFALNKEQFELESKEAEKVSNELYPVLNDGETGKFNPDLYRQWYANRTKEGVPLADMGLTGDPALDLNQLKLIYAHGVKASDQINANYKQVQEKQKQHEDTIREKALTETISRDRQEIALGRERLAIARRREEREAQKTSATKDPRAVAVKEANALSNAYQKEHDSLASQYNAPPKATETTQQYDAKRANLLKQMDALTKNYKQKEAAIYASHGVKLSDTKPSLSSAQQTWVSEQAKKNGVSESVIIEELKRAGKIK